MKWLGPFVCLPLSAACSLASELGDQSFDPSLPPEGFTEADRIGTWVSMVNRDFGSDTLVIQEDGLHKQTIDIRLPDYHYESEWLPWRVEYLDKSTVYVHRTGKRLYAFYPNLIEEGVVAAPGGTCIDFCRYGPSVMPGGKEIYVGAQMPPGAVMLFVESVHPRFVQPPRGFTLSLPPNSEPSSWYYKLPEP